MGNGERLALAFLAAVVLLPWIVEGSFGARNEGGNRLGGTEIQSGADADANDASRGPSWDSSMFGDASALGGSALDRLGYLTAELGDRFSLLQAGGDAGEILRALQNGERPGGKDGQASDRAGVGGGSGSRPLANVKDFGIRNRDPQFARLPLEEFDPRDLAVLEEIIAMNGLDESSSEFDFDDGDGRLDPRELGDQRWCNGRLRELRLGPDSFSTFGYRVTQLPPSIADLDGLMILEANAVGLQEVPESVGQLSGLRRISVFNNELNELPQSLADAPRLEEIQATGNQIRAVPEAVSASPTLQRLFVDTDRLDRIPEMLERQQAAVRDGKLRVPDRQIGPLGANCLPSS